VVNEQAFYCAKTARPLCVRSAISRVYNTPA
jgi:hypothetical protein